MSTGFAERSDRHVSTEILRAIKIKIPVILTLFSILDTKEQRCSPKSLLFFAYSSFQLLASCFIFDIVTREPLNRSTENLGLWLYPNIVISIPYLVHTQTLTPNNRHT